MDSTIKNITIILVILSLSFLGYYFYTQQASTVMTDEQVTQMLSNTEVFIGRSQELDRIAFDMSIFEDERFRSLRTFTKSVDEQPVGRSDPFAAVGSNSQ